jgi:hypothetical protein
LFSGYERVLEKLCKELSKNNQIFDFKKMESDLKPYWICGNVSRDAWYSFSKRCEKPLEYPAKIPDGKELGQMYVSAEFRHVYFDAKRKIKWPDDWIDPYPASIDRIMISDEYVKVDKLEEMDLNFISLAYYAIEFSSALFIPSFKQFPSLPETNLLTRIFLNKEDRIKLSRFLPAVIKDFNIFLKILEEVLTKYKISSSEVYLNVFRFHCSLIFKIKDMDDEEIFENIVRRADALTELRRRFREWLPSDERRAYYESTMLFPEDPFRWKFYIPEGGFPVPEWWKSDLPFRRRYEGPRILCKWPPNVDPDLDKRYERKLKEELWSSESFRYYDFDGNRLRLAKKTKSGLRFLGKVTNRKKGWIKIDKSMVEEEDLDREDVVIAVDERLEKLPKIPLEKIEFLKEDLPEMFK